MLTVSSVPVVPLPSMKYKNDAACNPSYIQDHTHLKLFEDETALSHLTAAKATGMFLPGAQLSRSFHPEVACRPSAVEIRHQSWTLH
mmetsp:Transcript_96486/g.191163  ORF Transcript_96486/g.191163 Transcript_96486/m.191163 type:complete len:87 (-) Transcript_96486:1102-1362(-)